MTPNRIKALRKRLNLTQQQLADRIGARQHTIARWETGRNEPKGAYLKALNELAAKVKIKRKIRSFGLLLALGTAVAFITGGCAKRFKAGDCVQNVRDGYIWRIISDSWLEGYAAQGWVNGRWGMALKGNLPISSDEHVKVACPFSTKMVEEVR